jgi:hypothetical protein
LIGNLLGKKTNQTVVPDMESIPDDFVLDLDIDDDLSRRTIVLGKDFGK